MDFADRVATRAKRLKKPLAVPIENTFGQDAAGRITRTDEQHVINFIVPRLCPRLAHLGTACAT